MGYLLDTVYISNLQGLSEHDACDSLLQDYSGGLQRQSLHLLVRNAHWHYCPHERGVVVRSFDYEGMALFRFALAVLSNNGSMYHYRIDETVHVVSFTNIASMHLYPHPKS